MKRKVFIILTLCAAIACKKSKPPVGTYVGVFSGSYTAGGQTFHPIRNYTFEVVKSDKNSLDLTHGTTEFSLEKIKESIKGTIPLSSTNGAGLESHTAGPITIDGTWRKESGEYFITGSFKYDYTINKYSTSPPTTTVYPVTGQFEIKSDK